MPCASADSVVPDFLPILPLMHPFLRPLAIIAIPAIFLQGMAAAQDIERIGPKRPPISQGHIQMPENGVEPQTTGSDTVLVGKLRGIVFLASQKDVRMTGLDGVEGIHCDGVHPPGGNAFEQAMSAYLGKPVSLVSVNKLTRDVVLYYRGHDRPVVDVILPEQDITQGVLQLILMESRTGAVKARGNRWFRSDRLESLVRLKPGDPIVGSRVEADLNRLNDNPFRQVNLLYTPGKEFGTTDLILETKDRFPLRVYTGYENTGSPAVGRNQYFAGFNWGDAFWLDHLLSYQFSAGGDFRSSLSHSVTYDIPLPWMHTLSFIGAYSESASPNESTVKSAGRSCQMSMRYKIPLQPVAGIHQSLSAGFDFKRSNNNLEFGGFNVFSANVDILQWLVDYGASEHDALGTTILDSTFYYSPGGLDSNNTDRAFKQGRASSSSDYVYTRIVLERLSKLPWNFSLLTRVTWQWANANLQASEQLGMGGSGSVRGYEEGEERGDSGVLLCTELRSPPISLIHRFDKTPKTENPGASVMPPAEKHFIEDQMQLLCFWDYGVAETLHPLSGDVKQVNLSGIGAGVRYSVNTWLSFRFDYAWQMLDTGAGDKFGSRAHFGLTISY